MPSGYKGSIQQPAAWPKAPERKDKPGLFVILFRATTKEEPVSETPSVEASMAEIDALRKQFKGAVRCAHFAMRRGDICPNCEWVHPG